MGNNNDIAQMLALLHELQGIVSDEKLEHKVTQCMIEFEQSQGNRLEVTDLKLEKSKGGYKGVVTGKLNGKDAVYDVTISDAGSDFDVDWELRK